MFDATLRQAKDRVGAPLALRLGAVSPNAVSIGGFVVGLIAAWQASQGNGVAAVTLWLFSRILDGLDGLIARLHGKQSDFGGYLDIVLDFVVYAAVPIGLTSPCDPAPAPAKLIGGPSSPAPASGYGRTWKSTGPLAVCVPTVTFTGPSTTCGCVMTVSSVAVAATTNAGCPPTSWGGCS